MLSSLLLATVLGAGAPRAEAADPATEAEEARVREQRRLDLLDRARAAVRPGDPTAGGMDDIEDVLDQEGPRWEVVAPEAVARARRLVGGGGEPGLIRQGAVLFRWVTTGAGLPRLVLREVEKPDAEALAITLDELVVLEDAADASETRAALLRRLVPAEVDVARQPDGQVLVRVPGPAPVVDPATDPAPDPDAEPAVVPDVDAVPALRGITGGYPWPPPAEGTVPPASPPPSPILQDEMASPWCRPWLRLRKVQLAERRRAWEAERPSRGLENEDRIRRRQERMERMRQQVKRLEDRRLIVLRGLDQMVEVEDALVTAGGLRAFEIEDLEASLAASAPPPLPEGAEGAPEDALPEDVRAQRATEQAKLEKRRVEQWVGQQELRLLYITARRASERLAIQDEALVVAREEERIATEAHALFLEELNRIRRERQLGRLQAQAFELRREQDMAAAGSTREDPALAAAWRARGELAAVLLEQNALLRQLVTLRQEVEVLVNTVRTDEAPGAPAASTSPATTAPSGEAPVEDVDPTTRALTLLAQTTASSLSSKRVALALDHLDVLPRETVASLFAAADERVETLAATERIRQATVDLANRFDATVAAVDAAQSAVLLAATQARTERTVHRVAERHLRKNVAEPNVSSFQRAREGIEQQVDIARERSAELRAFRAVLGDLGTRSLGIRVERTLTGDALRSAWSDTRWGAERALAWITFQGDDHLGTFVTANWLMLVCSLLLVLACLVGVRLLRRVIDRWLDRKASTIPALLRIGVSPTGESAEAKAARDRLEAERKVVEAAVLEQASGRDAKATPAATVTSVPADAPVVPGDTPPSPPAGPR